MRKRDWTALISITECPGRGLRSTARAGRRSHIPPAKRASALEADIHLSVRAALIRVVILCNASCLLLLRMSPPDCCGSWTCVRRRALGFSALPTACCSTHRFLFLVRWQCLGLFTACEVRHGQGPGLEIGTSPYFVMFLRACKTHCFMRSLCLYLEVRG